MDKNTDHPAVARGYFDLEDVMFKLFLESRKAAVIEKMVEGETKEKALAQLNERLRDLSSKHTDLLVYREDVVMAFTNVLSCFHSDVVEKVDVGTD